MINQAIHQFFKKIINFFVGLVLKASWKNFRKILKNSEIFLTGDEKGGKIGNIKKESRKRNE